MDAWALIGWTLIGSVCLFIASFPIAFMALMIKTAVKDDDKESEAGQGA